MKRIITKLFLIFLLSLNQQSFAQQIQAHQPQRPPLNPGYPFIRGMYIDCADEIIRDISNGNALGLKQELNQYIRKNYIRYIVLCGLEQAKVFGDPVLENALRKFINNTRKLFPGIRIGISGSDAGNFQNSGNINVQHYQVNSCFPSGILNSSNDLDYAVNNVGINTADLKRAELCKFFIRAANFGYDSSASGYNKKCKTTFDALYLEYRYWNHNTSLTDMKNEFNNYKTILSVMQFLKCNIPCIRSVDAEFLPTEIYNLQAWTAIDQITEADPLADRLMIPAFTNNENGTFDHVCKILHFLSDRFSKPRSEILIELSAESSSFSYCNNVMTPQDHLGNYLNGTAASSGNLYSVEKYFLDKFNDPNYVCTKCSCRPYSDNHYSTLNTEGNFLSGVMWTPYSMLKDHNLFRISGEVKNVQINSKPIRIDFFDINGRIIDHYKTINDYNESLNRNSLPSGIYILKIKYEDGKSTVKKILVSQQ